MSEEAKKAITLCPHCGLDYEILDNPLGDEDKQAWIRHVLGEEYFTKSYSLMGGRMEVTLRSRKDYENRDISLALSKYVTDLKSIINTPSIHAEASKYNLAISLHEIVIYDADGNPTITEFPQKSKEEFFKAWNTEGASISKSLYEDKIADMGSGKLAALTTALIQFDLLQTQLARHSNDPDFW